MQQLKTLSAASLRPHVRDLIVGTLLAATLPNLQGRRPRAATKKRGVRKLAFGKLRWRAANGESGSTHAPPTRHVPPGPLWSELPQQHGRRSLASGTPHAEGVKGKFGLQQKNALPRSRSPGAACMTRPLAPRPASGTSAYSYCRHRSSRHRLSFGALPSTPQASLLLGH